MRPSVTVNAEDFKQLIDNKGKLDAAAREGKPYEQIEPSSEHFLEQLAAQELCRISTLERL